MGGVGPPQAAILLAITSAAIVNYLGSAFFIFPSVGPRVSHSIRWRVLALAVLGYVVLLRFVFLGTLNLMPEEAYYWNYAQHLDIGYLDHPPMVAWMIWLGTKLAGNTEFAVRVGASLSWLVAAFFCFQLTRNLYGKTAAFVAVMMFCTLPFFFATGLLMTPDAPLTAAWAGALYFLERALIGERREAWLGVGCAWVSACCRNTRSRYLGRQPSSLSCSIRDCVAGLIEIRHTSPYSPLVDQGMSRSMLK